MDLDRYKNKKFGVFGLGISGISTMRYLLSKNAKFIASDDSEKTIQNIEQNHHELSQYIKDISDKSWQEVDYLILSPGIPLYFPSPHVIVQIANQAKIICDIELLYLDNPNNYFIGITGTNGKSTTTALITHILKHNKINAVCGGNIGAPVLDIKPETNMVFVIEVSSFQLDLLDKTKFNIAALLNITPDHLDRHGSMENYTKSKYKIFANQSEEDCAIIHSSLQKTQHAISFLEDNRPLSKLASVSYFEGNSERRTAVYTEVHEDSSTESTYKSPAEVEFRKRSNTKTYNIADNNSLLGEHNKQNLAAAIACCLKFGLDIEQILNAIPSFIGLKHRMQHLGTHNGVTFINDSKATNADSTAKALDSFDNIIWIVGGIKKEGGITLLEEFFPKIKTALLIGHSSDEFAETLRSKVKYQKCKTLENAFNAACKIAEDGDIILLSPSCASYDQWKNFEERGEAFINMVQNFYNKH